MKRKDINKTAAAASETAAAASKAGTEVRRAEAAAPDAAGRNAGKWKRVRGIAALVLTLFLLFLAFQAHLEDQPHESWYFPLAAALAVLAGLYLYIPLPLGKTGGKIYTVLTAICAPFLSFVIVEFYNKGFWHVGAALSTATAEPPYLMIILNTLIYALFFLVGSCYVVSGISETMIRYEHHPSSEQLTLRIAVSDMADGVAYLRTKGAILAMLVAVLFVNFFIAPVMGNFLPFFVRTNLAEAPCYLLDGVLTPELWSSVVQMCFGVSSLLGAAALSGGTQLDGCGRRIARLLCVMAAVVIGLTVCYLLFIDLGSQVSAFLVALCLGFLALGFLVASINVPASTVLMRVVDRDKLSKVNSLTNVGSQGMVPIASVLAGAILETFGSTALLGFCSLGFAATAVALLFNRQIDGL